MKTYFLKNNVNNLIKIGKSEDVEKRAKQVVGQCHFIQVSVFHIIEGDYESKFHSFYRDFRKEGEWFDIPDLSVEKINSDFEQATIATLPKTVITKKPESCHFKGGHSVHYFTFEFSIIRLYGEVGKEIIQKIREIPEQIDCIIVKQGIIQLFITRNRHIESLLKTKIRCEMEIVVQAGNKKYKFTLKEVKKEKKCLS